MFFLLNDILHSICVKCDYNQETNHLYHPFTFMRTQAKLYFPVCVEVRYFDVCTC